MMPSVLCFQLFVVLSVFGGSLDASPLYSGVSELSEISGDELQDVDVGIPMTESQRWHLMAGHLHSVVKALREEQFDRDFRDTANMTLFEGVRIKTPVLKASDGCLSRNFIRGRCLGSIHSVLMWYKEHLSYIEMENLTQSLMNDVRHGTKRLLESLHSQVQLRETPIEDFSGSLQAKSAWKRKIFVHSILFHFTNVMIDTCRAIHFMSRHRTGDQRKDRKKNSDLISDKN